MECHGKGKGQANGLEVSDVRGTGAMLDLGREMLVT